FLLVVPASLPVNSTQELITYAKAHPGELNFGSSGNGSPQRLSAELLQLSAGIKMNHVPYKGAAPAVADLLAGRIQVWIGAANSLLPHIKDGKLRLLGVTTPQRVASLLDAPAIAETLPGFSVDTWLGIFVPAKTPSDVVKKVNSEIARVLGNPEVKAKLAPQGIELGTNSPAEFEKVIRGDCATCRRRCHRGRSTGARTASPRCCARSTFRTSRSIRARATAGCTTASST